jgi:hypothetical protein
MSSLETAASSPQTDAAPEQAIVVQPRIAPRTRRSGGWPLACAGVDIAMLLLAAGATALGGNIAGSRNPSLG